MWRLIGSLPIDLDLASVSIGLQHEAIVAGVFLGFPSLLFLDGFLHVGLIQPRRGILLEPYLSNSDILYHLVEVIHFDVLIQQYFAIILETGDRTIVVSIAIFYRGLIIGEELRHQALHDTLAFLHFGLVLKQCVYFEEELRPLPVLELLDLGSLCRGTVVLLGVDAAVDALSVATLERGDGSVVHI